MRLALTLGVAGILVSGGGALAQSGAGAKSESGDRLSPTSLAALGSHTQSPSIGPIPLARGRGSFQAQAILTDSDIGDFYHPPPAPAERQPISCPKGSAPLYLGTQWICSGSH